ncbi:hypothetical protein [Paenibacillus luteus]|uniref:hypothetical protein n=1 Tax=Paenibacillus luteus TaxID=2545753 RepID=UPI0019D61641|nr:hypothetical protein [Paenibacillus luteus]
MNKAKAITAGAIALTLALGGGSLWAGQLVNAAAASSGKPALQSTQSDNGAAKKDRADKRGGFGRGFEQIQEQLTTYLGVDEAALQTKLETLTLSEIAVEQGKTRAELKEKLVEWLEAAAPAKTEAGTTTDADQQTDAGKQLTKPDAATIAEKLLDSKGFGFGKQGGGGGKGGFGQNLTAAAAVLGLTADELKAEQESGKTLAAVATEKGIEVQTVIDALVSEQKTKLDAELAAGSLTQDQYDSKFEKAVEHATQHVNGLLPQRGEGGRGGFGGGNLDVFATALGLTEDELKAELESGKTLAAIAAEKGIAVQTLIDLNIKDKQAKLAEQLAAGTITQEQYDTKLEEATERATKQVNGELPARGENGGKGGHGGKGPRGERPDGAAPQATTGTDAAETDSSNA